AAEVLAEAAAHRALHGVEAVFLDRVTSGPEHLAHYAGLAARLPRPLLLNPGVRPDPGYLALAAVVVTFEGDWAAHRALTGPDPAGRTWHLVHGVPRTAQPAVLRRAAELGASLAYATDRRMPNPWDGLPGGWPG
ncbi:spherulation-specific family 4 protein, partial [Pseudonocardia pini]|uniref:spherulation-specific family 4 protein n=1 Tax=Pseudonocardia pini TaxID=2758030 RepID=UPI001C68A256